MNKLLEQSLLYDFYGELLTQHQKEIYEDVILNDMSLSEVAQQYGISRQGVHDMIKRCQKILDGYEEKLHLVEKFIKIRQMVNEIHDHATKLQEEEQTSQMGHHLAEIETLSNSILEEF